MPLLRHECKEFVLTWNSHRIRSQTNRANSVAGIPDRLYFDPPNGIEQWGKTPNPAVLDHFDEIFGEYGKRLSHRCFIHSLPQKINISASFSGQSLRLELKYFWRRGRVPPGRFPSMVSGQISQYRRYGEAIKFRFYRYWLGQASVHPSLVHRTRRDCT
jgi:hypothetical protein